ncbi:hypothetical protein BKN38_02465 [Helicobacter sp. CLO-3]|uniref:CinA family protein n=1 Tax=unclassified Helicobacter TaxID=2593540 RepID=UPI000805A40F|nr:MULTISPECIES: CinA family protein [unclassified Helicobacter]OBV29436.1 hypothetical protein BA723_00570 [Helicobacter sp. CLO-3]OHU84668.1 hypothetical protein BKN38_02465 [Helicobacter sp. CLO-3]
MRQNVSKHIKVFFLNMDLDSARVLCDETLRKLALTWEVENASAIIKGERADEFAKWAQGIFQHHIVIGEDIESIAIRRLKEEGLCLATAESCTGGLLAYHFTRNAGASEVFLGGVVSYANEIKERILGVDSASLEDFGAVSEVVVAQMLSGTIERFGAGVALATSGVAGPGGGSAQKPVGTVFIGMQIANKEPIIERYNFVPKVGGAGGGVNSAGAGSANSAINAGAESKSSDTQATMRLDSGACVPRLTPCHALSFSAREDIQYQACQKAIDLLLKNI